MTIKEFFEAHPYLNISKVGEKAGINPALMRSYASGMYEPAEKQKAKIRATIETIVEDISNSKL